MIKPIITDHQFLSRPSTPATRQDLPLAQDLQDTLAAHRDECVGMAANMIGSSKRIIIATLGPLDVVMFNPRITARSNPYQTTEGCLSLKGKRPAKRFKKITVVFENLQFQKQQLKLEGFAAEIVQHEIDHCDGVII